MTPDNDESPITAAARALGRIRTPKKTAASRATVKAATAARTANAAPCTCGREDGTHVARCPAYHRTKMAGYRARKKEKEGLADDAG